MSTNCSILHEEHITYAKSQWLPFEWIREIERESVCVWETLQRKNERRRESNDDDDDDNKSDRNAQNNIHEKIIQVIEELSEQMENLRHSLIF